MGEPGGGEEGGIGLLASNVEGASDASATKVESAGDVGATGVVVPPSIDTVYRASVQGTIVEKREGRMTEVWIARSALNAKSNAFGGVRTEMGPLARTMVSHD